ncbi:insulin receptor substrate 1 isoform X2 [Leptopilina heterotoma]|uniref:insulin receptor substrate 1 isoform X2 n=1 Tax=Leptopilina heterotoma TaxID=63436 RepID=UPI001CA85E88|nr:insulin receptor substrate 1 isoform X2 [Leptopilina heterotoma]
MSSSRILVPPSTGNVIRSGHLRKLKTLKKKYFVLREEAPGCPACLEYYDSKKKFENRQPPKRQISLHSCFNINKRGDIKQKNVIALYTKDECFCLVLDTEKDLGDWLNSMLLLQNGGQPDGEQPRPTFEHVWQVTMQKKGLGERKNIQGPYRLCLTDSAVTFYKVGANNKSDFIEFPLVSIRRCGFMERIFYMEMGRSAVTGGGEFWMEAEDNNIAQNMHAAILNAMTNSNTNRDEVVPRQRMRSSSANEASKPISVLPRRHTGQKLLGFSPLEEQRTQKEQVDSLQQQNATVSAPSQCCQSQSTSSSNTLTAPAAGTGTGTTGNATTNVNSSSMNRRRHSVASHPHSTNNSQSVHVNTTSSSSSTTTSSSSTTTTTKSTTTSTTVTATIATITTTTATNSHQRTLSLPLAAVAINQTQSSKRSVLRCTSGRERCDSLPSRARTTSVGHPTPLAMVHPRAIHLGSHAPRPHSMYGRGMSYSPPVSSMPISPASGACSTDSAGSSLSMDDGSENILEEGLTSRYGHSLTPDEPVILEENGDDYAPWPSNQQKYSPNYKSHSPSQSSYVEMYSPCGSSPSRGGGVYMPMSPATTAHSHSRASSLVEDTGTLLPDGYVPMAPVRDDGYVDMDPSNSQNGHFPDDMSGHGGSSCSVTSGTPSTDLRFSEYHLDKVTSYLPAGEDLQARPIRAYSVGSRPEPVNRHRKNSTFRDRYEVTQQDVSRVRAFSVGSRSKRPEMGRLLNITTAPLLPGGENSSTNKSNSAPLLSSSWGHNSGCSVNSERMEDLMELDFSRSHLPTTLSSPPSTYSQSQSYSTATDNSSYVDMSPGQQTSSTTAPYVDMSGINKHRNNNNNNNTTTANHNHNNIHSSTSIATLRPVITTLKPVEEAESPYMKMDSGLDFWPKSGSSPKQMPSPLQDDYMLMNGPPGGTRTAPVDFPQPRRTQDGYVEMSFKVRPSLEQDYINMNMGASARSHQRNRNSNRKEKIRSQPIAILASSKSTKTPNFLPLNGSPNSESLESTPATPPRATPTGSTATIFPFSLNSPQSPEKPFTTEPEVSSKSSSIGDVSSASGDYALMQPSRKISAPSHLPSSSLNKLADDSGGATLPKLVRGNSLKKVDANTLTRKCDGISKNVVVDKPPSPKESISNNPMASQDVVFVPLAKRLNDLTVTRPRLVTTSPTTSPTPTGFKPVQSKPSSPKLMDETTPTPTSTPTPISTPTPTQQDSEDYEKLQPGYEKLASAVEKIQASFDKASTLHYASLDLPEVSGAPPVSPTPLQEGFKYAEIDFGRLKQN